MKRLRFISRVAGDVLIGMGIFALAVVLFGLILAQTTKDTDEHKPKQECVESCKSYPVPNENAPKEKIFETEKH